MNPFNCERTFFDGIDFSFHVLVEYEDVLTWLVVILDPFPVLSCVIVEDIPVLVVSCESPVGKVGGVKNHIYSKGKMSLLILNPKQLFE